MINSDSSQEIEHKYLVSDPELIKKLSFKKFNIIQGYLSKTKKQSTRIRISDDSLAELGIKGKKKNLSRYEYEISSSIEHAKYQASFLTEGIIYKTRYLINHKGHIWEVDFYHGANSGIIVAEIELKSRDEKYIIPDFIGDCINGFKEYSNYRMSLKEPLINNEYYSVDFNSIFPNFNNQKILN
jgi:adenylate cyclase